jgi:hypothetical protein
MWRSQADGERARNLLYKIAKAKNVTFAKLIEGLEGCLNKKSPHHDLLEQLLDQMFPEPCAPEELVQEMLQRKPQKVEPMKISPPKNAQLLVDMMAEQRKAADTHAQNKIDEMVQQREAT